MDLKGRRLADTRLGEFPIDYEDLQPGDYWIVLNRLTGKRMNVKDNVSDRAWWGAHEERWEGNLTGLVLGVMTPTDPPMYGMLSIHTVRLNDDDTVSVLPNGYSIMVHGGPDDAPYHGYIYHGEWRAC